MSEPVSLKFARAVSPFTQVVIDVMREGMYIKLPCRGEFRGWHLMSPQEIDLVLDDARKAVHECCGQWLRQSHLPERPPEWLQRRYEDAKERFVASPNSEVEAS